MSLFSTAFSAFLDNMKKLLNLSPATPPLENPFVNGNYTHDLSFLIWLIFWLYSGIYSAVFLLGETSPEHLEHNPDRFHIRTASH